MRKRTYNVRIWLATLNEMIPGWVQEYRFHPPRRWRFDLACPKRFLAVEVEGGIFSRIRGRHVRGTGYLRDLEKYNRAMLDGWTILRYAPWQFSECLRDIEELLRKPRPALQADSDESSELTPLTP